MNTTCTEQKNRWANVGGDDMIYNKLSKCMNEQIKSCRSSTSENRASKGVKFNQGPDVFNRKLKFNRFGKKKYSP